MRREVAIILMSIEVVINLLDLIFWVQRCLQLTHVNTHIRKCCISILEHIDWYKVGNLLLPILSSFGYILIHMNLFSAIIL